MKMRSQELIFILTILAMLVNPMAGSRILFYSPMTAKSACMAFVPLANELARKGHSVTVVTQWSDMDLHQDIVQPPIPNLFTSLQNILSHGLLKTELNPKPVFGDISGLYEKSIAANLEGLEVLKPHVNDKTKKFDIVVTGMVLMANELSYYIAYRSNASLVLFSSFQQALPHLSTALGSPHNPAYVPTLVPAVAFNMR